jgi:hypothetical protein
MLRFILARSLPPIRRTAVVTGVLLGLVFAAVGQDGPTLAAAPAGPLGTNAPLGRANPFKPLIVDEPEAAVPLAAEPPDGPIVPPPVPTPAPPTPEPIAYVAIAYDDAPGPNEGPVAAIRVGGRTRFVRVGDAVDGATIVDISSDQLTLRGPRGTTAVPRARR